MRVIEVIPARRWVNKVTGQTASIYGAAPYVSDADKVNWAIEESGWTWLMDNGTVGLGRIPAATKDEALAVMARVNGRT